MSAADWFLLSPWLLLGAALLAVILVVGFWRHHGVMAAFTTAALTLTAASALLVLGATPARATIDALPLVRIDGLALLLVALFAAAGALTAAVSRRYLEGRRGDPEEYYILLMCAVFGAMTLAAADHFAIVLLGLEILSISLYTLIAYPEEDSWPLEAGLKYLILSGVASTTLLFGVALLYARTGSLGLDALAVGDGAAPLMVLTGAVMVLAGLSFKLSLAPFHLWTPDVYQGAPAPITGFVATVSKGAVVVVLLRIVAQSDLLASPQLFSILAAMAVLSMLLGNLLAVMQRSVKRVLAFSSVAHMGYLMVAVLAIGSSGGVALGTEAAVVYVVAYTVMTLAAFAVITTLSGAGATRDMDDIDAFTGLLWRQPLAAVVLAVALLSLAGIPLTLGFIGKFYLVAAGVDRGLWPLLWVLLLGSGIGLFYYLRILYALIRPTDPDVAEAARPSLAGGWVLGLLAGLLLLLGVWPMPLIEMVQGVLSYQEALPQLGVLVAPGEDSRDLQDVLGL